MCCPSPPNPSSARSSSACSALTAPTRSRRRRSIALLRAVRVIHAAGLLGTPRSGQLRRACTNASWTASSARSKLPVARIRAATARPASRRNRRSMSERASPVVSALRFVRELLDRPQLDGAVHRAWTTASRFYRLVEVGDIQHVVATKLLLGLREGSIRHDRLAVGSADRRSCGGWLQRVASHEPALLGEPVAVVVPWLDLRGLLLGCDVRHRRCRSCFVVVDQQQVLHARSFAPGGPLRPLTLLTNARAIPRPILR